MAGGHIKKLHKTLIDFGKDEVGITKMPLIKKWKNKWFICTWYVVHTITISVQLQYPHVQRITCTLFFFVKREISLSLWLSLIQLSEKKLMVFVSSLVLCCPYICIHINLCTIWFCKCTLWFYTPMSCTLPHLLDTCTQPTF